MVSVLKNSIIRVYVGFWLLHLIFRTFGSAELLPNIVFIMADDLGYGDVGFNGQDKIKTPYLDKMAEEGMVFTQHYSGSTVCMPSRCALLTGRHMGRATIRGNPRWTATGVAIDLGSEDVTIADELDRAGYFSGIIGKWGLAEASDTGMPLEQGFDYFFGYRKHRDAHHYYWPDLWENSEPFHLEGNDYYNKKGIYTHDLFEEKAIDFISNQKERPFFLYLALTIPHYELTVPEEEKEMYAELGWPERPMKAAHYRHDPEGNVSYAAMVTRMDRSIGNILKHLDGLGIAENTLIIFTSDNGPEYEKQDRFFNSNGNLRGGKRDLYEGGIRVPFVAYWPSKIKAAKRSDHVSAFDDVLPTFCELAGIEPSSEITGISFLPTLMGDSKNQELREYLYWEFNERQGPIQAIRMGQWKGVRFAGKPLELYNLEQDVSETNDVSDDYPYVVAQILKKMNIARSEDPNFTLTKREISR